MVWVDRKGLESEPANLVTSEIKEGELHLPVSPGHYQEFVNCVKSRGATLTPASVALLLATPGWLGQIAMLTGKKLKWDPIKERILNNPAAEKLLARTMRPPWKLG